MDDVERSSVSGDEAILLRKRANHMVRPYYSHGGHLILTDRRLVFEPHILNLRAKEFSIELRDVEDIGRRDALLGLSKQIWVRPRMGREERFVVWGRAELIDAVKRRMDTSAKDQADCDGPSSPFSRFS